MSVEYEYPVQCTEYSVALQSMQYTFIPPARRTTPEYVLQSILDKTPQKYGAARQLASPAWTSQNRWIGRVVLLSEARSLGSGFSGGKSPGFFVFHRRQLFFMVDWRGCASTQYYTLGN